MTWTVDGLHRRAGRPPALRMLGGLHRDDAVTPPRIALRQPRLLLRWALLGSAAVTAMAALACLLLPPPEPSVATSPGASPEPPMHPSSVALVDISHPLHLYGLTGSPFARLPLSYAARRSPDGDERQDVLVFGSFAASAFAQVAVRRTGMLSVADASRGSDAAAVPRPETAPADLLVDIVRLAATSGLAVTRAGVPEAIGTRAGIYEAASVTIQNAAAALPCFGYRLTRREERAHALSVLGLACGTAAKPIERSALACMLSRLDLGPDAAARRGDDCGTVEAAH